MRGGTLRGTWKWRAITVGAAAVLALGACTGDDDDEEGSTTLANGVEVELVGETPTLGGQTLNISAEEQDGEVTGEFRFSDEGEELVVAVECADTDTDDVVILGGTVTESSDDEHSGL